MQLLNPLVKWVLKHPLKRIAYFMEHPNEVQENVWKNLLKAAENTVWGKQYYYREIRTYKQFQERVPISSYEDIFPYIERMMQGETDILWPSPIHWFAKSSGTTNARSKFIPVSRASLEDIHFKGGRDLMALYINSCPETNFSSGKGLSIGGSLQRSDTQQNIFYGDISAVVVQNLPRWAQWLRTPSLKVAHLDEWEEKIEQMAQETMRQNVTTILGVPTWTIVLIRRILEITGKQHIKEVWENLEAFLHGAVAFQPYRALFSKLAPGIRYMEVYNASEGFFGLQDSLDRDDMLLMLDYGIFYEFIPLEELERTHPKTYTIGEVELGKNYAMVISTNGGLWRYKIGDTVKFTSKHPYRIKISGRTKHYINAFGEELMIDNATVAIAEACQQTGASIVDFTACPIYIGDGTKGGHEWLIEFEHPPHNLATFTEVLDRKLRELNSDYDAKRYQNIALRLPVIHQLPKDTFHNWMRKRGKLGGQHKVPRLSNTREFVDDILAMSTLS